MTTALKLGPADHGRALTYDEFEAASGQPGYKYELIEGRLYVSPEANFPEGWVERWLYLRLEMYRMARPDVINFAYNKARVFLPGRPEETTPEPDVAAYHGFPLEQPLQNIRWQDVSPVLVVEVVSEDDPDKDLVRNVRLYREVPSIREYWILDPRESVQHPSLVVYRREGSRWRRREVASGETYTTRLLPGFELVLDTRS
jgi:Uma2 family endonuclease